MNLLNICNLLGFESECAVTMFLGMR